jgi:murein DD-endopeptidase MepM/ murein hydrolase activator NlpD
LTSRPDNASQQFDPAARAGRWAAPETWLRLASHGLTFGLILAALWIARITLPNVSATTPEALVATAPSNPTTPGQAIGALPEFEPLPAAPLDDPATITRLALLDTDIPSRPRYTIETYVVQKGDTVFGIAAKFNLKPETILWGNPELVDQINQLRPGKALNILPIDGALRVVQAGDTLEKISQVFHGSLEEIINFAGNDLDPSDPQIKEGQAIVIPGGWRETVTWSLPVVSRARGPGGGGEPGSCAGGYSGPTGTYTFVWPANNRYLSGWDYSPTAHPGIDIAAGTGAPIYASDTGVVVFSGWSTRGYGNLVIIDHGNSWQTAYAHLSQINYACGQTIYQGQLLGLAGSTGNSTGAHLHFEMRSDLYGRVNPWLYLP